MNTRLILLGCAACLLSPVSADDTPLGKQMEAFNDAYKAMRTEKDPAKGASLAREAQETVIKAIAETPALLTQMPDGPVKVKAIAEYRKMMGQVFVTLCEMEEAFLDGKTEEVEQHILNLKDMKKAGHNKFMED